MIRIEVKEYCDNCLCFEPDIERPTKVVFESLCEGDSEVTLSDTVIRCENRRKCEAMKRYLENKISKGEKGTGD